MSHVRLLSAAVLAFAFVVLSGCAEVRPQGQNRIAVLVDGSGSFRSRRMEALRQASQLLEAMAQRKTHRWEPASDYLCVLCIDQVAEPVFEGSVADFRKMESGAWIKKFEARKDFDGWTDVNRAFARAAQKLAGGQVGAVKYIFAWTDGEQDLPSAPASARANRMGPTEGFVWDELGDCSVNIYWMPPAAKIAWMQAAEEHSLADNFHLFSTSQSAAEKAIPPEPVGPPKMTDSERMHARAKYLSWAKTGVLTLGGLALVFGLGLGGAVWAARRRRQRGARTMQPRDPRAPRSAVPSAGRPVPRPARSGGAAPRPAGARSVPPNPAR